MTGFELSQKAKSLPLLPGVYIMKGKGGSVIYVGKAKQLQKRVSQYFVGDRHDIKVKKMVASVVDFDTIVTNSEFEALVLECSQIKLYRPKYNILLKDDKGYCYIKISGGDYPRITAAFQKENDGAEYIGPYTSSFALKEMVETANLAFLLPDCQKKFPRDIKRERVCLNYHIGRCMGVCTGRISKEQYDEAVLGAVTLIKKGKKELLCMLKSRMSAAADALDFENAAQLRDRIAVIERMNKGQKVALSGKEEQDVVASVFYAERAAVAVLRFRGGRLYDKKEFIFYDANPENIIEEFLLQYYQGELPLPKKLLLSDDFENRELVSRLFFEQKNKKVDIIVPQKGKQRELVEMARLNAIEHLTQEAGRAGRSERILDSLARLLSLNTPPQRIEAYDISNWGEGTSVAGMVVFVDAKPYKAAYRRFAMKTVAGIDDCASMEEVLQRRIKNYSEQIDPEFSKLPDIVLIDGGIGQLGAARRAAEGTPFEAVPFFGMVKDNNHKTRALVCSAGEIALAKHKDEFIFIAKIQNETHRFAIAYEQKRAKNKKLTGELIGIYGVGEATQKRLFKIFKTIQKIKTITQQELQSAGFSKNVSENIVRHFAEKEGR